MIYSRKQRTIRNTTELCGFGYWSGQDVRVQFRPAAIDSGIVFVRSDLNPEIRIPAVVTNRIERPRRTALSAGGATVEMVEHIMAALAGLAIDNCEVWVDREEMPSSDGSSRAFVDAILSAEIVEQDAPRAQLVVTDTLRVGDEECWVEAKPAATGGLAVKYHLDYDSPAIGRQTYRLNVTPSSFKSELAPARTFLLESEAQWLREQGLGQRVTYQDVLVFNDEGPIDNELRFPDECVRHKTLDVIGDLALAGCDLVAEVMAHCSGHRQNAHLVSALLTEYQIDSGMRISA